MPETWVLLALPIKTLFYASCSIAIGLVVFERLFLSSELSEKIGLRKIALGSTFAALVLASLLFIIQGAQLTGDVSGLTDPEMLGLIAQGPAGTTLALQVIGLGIMIFSLGFLTENSTFPLVGGFLTIISFLWIGHTNDLDFFTTKSALLIHITVFIFWMGALWPLYRLLDYPELAKEVAEISHKFGRIAFVLVPIMLIAGGIMALSLLSHPSHLFTSVYGATFLAKIVVVGFLMVLAGLNKFRFVPSLRNNETGSAIKFQRAIMAEAGCFTIILILTAILTGAASLPH